MPLNINEQRFWTVEADGIVYNILAEYDERGNYITGTLAKVSCTVNDQVIYADKERIKPASRLSNNVTLNLQHPGLTVILQILVKNNLWGVTQSVELELLVNGVYIHPGTNYVPNQSAQQNAQPSVGEVKDIKAQLTELAEMHKQGLIDEAEYKALKSKIIG